MAEKSEIIDAIEALSVHCRPPLMSVDQRSLWMRDWIADLEQFPIEAVQKACRTYRHSGATKFPTPGQLLPLARSHQPQPTEERIQEWRPLSEEEFAALSLRDKIRHHGIMAHEARVKAGPMWRNTGAGDMRRPQKAHVEPQDMPDVWRRWTSIADGHEAEAKRLRTYLHRQPQAAA